MTKNNRRDFIKKSGLLVAPLLIPIIGFSNDQIVEEKNSEKEVKTKQLVNFIFDGLFFSPTEYIQKLQDIDKVKPLQSDMYGQGGETQLLQEAFAKLTGKEKAIYIPSGTMANQIAIKFSYDVVLYSVTKFLLTFYDVNLGRFGSILLDSHDPSIRTLNSNTNLYDFSIVLTATNTQLIGLQSSDTLQLTCFVRNSFGLSNVSNTVQTN